MVAQLLRSLGFLEARRDELRTMSIVPETLQPPGDGEPVIVDLSGPASEHVPRILAAMDRLRAAVGEVIEEAAPPLAADADEPPAIPPQGPGVRFAVQANGTIGIAPPEPLDDEGSDLDHLCGIYPALQDAVADLVEALRSGNRPPDGILPARAEAYRRLVAGPLGELDVHRLYAAGRRFERAEETTAAEIAADTEPPLTAKEREAIASLRSLHRGFVMATQVGRRANAYEAAYDWREEPAPGEAGVAVLDAVQNDVETFTPEVIGEARDAAVEIAPGREGAPGSVLGAGTFRNVLSLTIKAALAAAAATVLIRDFGAAGSVVGATVMWLTLKRLEKAPEFDAVTRRYTGRDLAALLAWPLAFVLRHEPKLWRLADRGGVFAYIHPALDWIKRHTPPAA